MNSGGHLINTTNYGDLFYWAATSSHSTQAFFLYFALPASFRMDVNQRYWGLPIRPVANPRP